jgi:hypothetical protein
VNEDPVEEKPPLDLVVGEDPNEKELPLVPIVVKG